MKKLLATAGLLLTLTGCTAATEEATNIVPSTDQSQALSIESQPAGSNPTSVNPALIQSTEQSQVSVIQQTQQLTTPMVPATQVYNNSAYNFQFNYPTVFSFTNPNYANLDDKIVQLQLPSTTYPKTNFGDAGFSVSVGTAKTLNGCLALNEPEGSNGFSHTTMINGVKFYESNGNGAGAGNFYITKTYRTFVRPSCYEINETVHTLNIENFDPGTVTEVNQSPIWTQLQKILSSFRFTS